MKESWNAPLYNQKHAFVYQYGESLVDILAPKEDETILDLGCGSGQLTEKISHHTKHVVGMDLSPEMIADAQAKFPNIRFMVGDAASFSFETRYDAIFSNATLHWVTAYTKAAQCMYENLKPGGRLVAEFGGKGNVHTILEQLRASLSSRGYKEQAEHQLWYFPSTAEYAKVLEDVGFHVQSIQHYERPTELVDATTGVIDWLSMFADTYFENVAPMHIEEIKEEVQQRVAHRCFKAGKWYADYVRIRVVAIK